MQPLANITELPHLIQLSVAPVFLLAGIAGFLNVMSGRLARIVDRSRTVERRSHTLTNPELIELNNRELAALRRRIRLNNLSIGFCTFSALLVCILVVTLFAGSYWSLNVGTVIAGFFVCAMLLLIIALVLFLKETQLATRTLREASEFPE
ncbi:DUF2721 domain-containing protein [Mangrovimicrobium sediminis]|uniref:DUF2721 domain-containing protein n=1 Tax=Mangrovimicrobium sediminis TaxID=2562682 RepID=A0A4Z0LX54_9GAMM|nr:DUF2721 domain-containing protein [Haliea sp. SAOS-164]TGD71820.1 DUF2721 domain-containing protein [Haliea sp. SAOS-164]